MKLRQIIRTISIALSAALLATMLLPIAASAAPFDEPPSLPEDPLPFDEPPSLPEDPLPFDEPPSLPEDPLPFDDPSLPGEDRRQGAVDAMVRALESYGEQHDWYMVEGGGSIGRGAGWAFYEEAGSDYPVSTASLLIAAGHLAADAPRDPLWDSPLSIAGDVLVYRCEDRVGVFTREGTGTPSPEDRAWWANNDCNPYPINNLNATYYKLSRPLD